LENEPLLEVLFDAPSAKKARDEFGPLKDQYQAKGLRSHMEVALVSSQGIGPDKLAVRVAGQVITTGKVNGEQVQEVEPKVIDFVMGRNPDLGSNKFYPLRVAGYEYAQQKAASR
jgi:hypothetical protein